MPPMIFQSELNTTDMIKIVLLVVVVPVILVVLFAIKRKLKSPEKDFVNALIEVSLTPLRMLKLGPYSFGDFDLDRSLKRAVKKAKLTDFGGTDFIDNYRLMMNNRFYKNQKFTNIGYIAGEIELNMTWIRRLKFVDYLKKNPDVLNVPVPSPVFVMGLPRTGTTFLHRLLSMDPAIRAPLLWELLNPVPLVPPTASAAEKALDRSKRTEIIKKLIDKRKQMGDHALSHIHEIEHNLPEECLMALTDELPINLQFLYSCYMAAKEFLTIDSRNTYKHYRKVLQLLSHQLGECESPRRWMLKCPIHLFYTKELATAFPDAKLIWTHRHPVSAVPSLCSLLKASHQIYFEKEGRDDASLGRALKTVTGDLLQQAPKDIAQSGLPCFDVTYETLVKDPVGTIKSIYARFDWKFTPEYATILENYLIENKKDRAKKASGAVLHSYHPEEFGLTEGELCEGPFADYCKRYSVPMSRN